MVMNMDEKKNTRWCWRSRGREKGEKSGLRVEKGKEKKWWG
jgi:hypothetical protein